MNNRQLTVLCGAFLAGSLLIGGTNVLLVRSAARMTPSATRTLIAIVVPSKGDAYFGSCREGAEEAARELDVELAWDGPNGSDSTAQFQIVQTWISRKVDGIAVAASERSGMGLILRKARALGIPVVTWNSDVDSDARDLFVAPVSIEEAGRLLAEDAAHLTSGEGALVVLAGPSLEWSESFQVGLSQQHAPVRAAAVRRTGEDVEEEFRETRDLIRSSPSVRLLVALPPVSVSSVAEAVLLSGRKDVKVIGVGHPTACNRYRSTGVMRSLVHWSARDLGYLTVYATTLLAHHELDPTGDSLPAGRLGKRDICDGEIVLGRPAVTRSWN
jgi:rhamnose transport system permease protein